MLQAYLDESVKDGLLVLGGYIATAEKWALFSDKWSELLGMRSEHFPLLDEFHMSEMRSTPERRELTAAYYRIIEEHVDAAVACVIDIKALNDAFKEFILPPEASPLLQFRNPYCNAFAQLIPKLAHARQQHVVLEHIEGELDLVLDASSNMRWCIEGWSDYVSIMTKQFRQVLGGPPIYRDSRKTMPLQAADLWCYWIREWSKQGLSLEQIGALPFEWKARRAMEIVYVRRSKEDYVQHIKRALLLREISKYGLINGIFGFDIEAFVKAPKFIEIRLPSRDL